MSFCYPEETSGLGHREHSWLSLGEHVTMMRSPLPETLFPFGKCPQQQLLPKSMPAELQTLGKPPNKVSLHAPLFHGGPPPSNGDPSLFNEEHFCIGESFPTGILYNRDQSFQ